jgi:hypothetical protein
LRRKINQHLRRRKTCAKTTATTNSIKKRNSREGVDDDVAEEKLQDRKLSI